jgi:hypothetical protein
MAYRLESLSHRSAITLHDSGSRLVIEQVRVRSRWSGKQPDAARYQAV